MGHIGSWPAFLDAHPEKLASVRLDLRVLAQLPPGVTR
jgi:hypothetical protein